MSGNARAFTRKMLEYQQANSSSSASNSSALHRPLSQRSSMDSNQNSRIVSSGSVTSSGTGASNMEEILLQMSTDSSGGAAGAAANRNSVRSGSSRSSSVTANSQHYSQMLGAANQVTPGQSASYLARMSQEHHSIIQSGYSTSPHQFTDAVMDPVDFEILVVQCPTELADYPQNDLQVELVNPSQWRSDSVNETGVNEFEGVSHQVADCLHQYKKSHYIIHRSHSSFSPQFVPPHQHTHKVLRMVSLLPYEEKANEDTLTRPNSSVFLQTHSTESEQPSEEMLRSYSAQTFIDGLKTCREIRGKQRFPELMSLFLLDVSPPAVERSLKADFDQPVSYISVRCQKYIPKITFEPLFFSLFLYDLKNCQRLSETFYFDQNDDYNMLGKLKKHLPSDIDMTSRIQEAIFSLSHPTDELYIVVRVEKILQPGDVSEPYLHPEKSVKSLDKLNLQSSYWCENLGAYKMPFLWTAVNLISTINNSESQSDNSANQQQIINDISSLQDNYSDCSGSFTDSTYNRSNSSSSSLGRRTGSAFSNRLSESGAGSNSGSNKSKTSMRPSLLKDDETFSQFLSNFHPLDLRFKSFILQDGEKISDEDMATCLLDFKKDRGKKFKSIDFDLSLEIKPVSPPFSRCLTTDLKLLNCDCAEPPCSKMILDFPVRPNAKYSDYVNLAKPHSEYINLLYVYPKMLNLSSKTGTARNILMKVKLVQGSTNGPFILKRIFGRSSDAQLKDVAFCPVNYHSKTPKFYDEVKIQLPATMGEFHHLLFEFYHVTCNANKKGVNESESFVGTTWLPLLDENKRLVVGTVNLPVSSDKLPQDYYRVHPKVQLPSVKWLDGHKELFSLTINAHSSVHTMDENLDIFLKQYASFFNPDKSSQSAISSKHDAVRLSCTFKKSIEDLKSEVSLGPLIHFLHVTLDKLLSLIVRKTSCGEVFAHNSFEALIAIVDRIHTSNINTFVDGFNRVHLLLSYVSKNLNLSDFQYNSRGEQVFDTTQLFMPTANNNNIATRKTLHRELLVQIMAAKNDRAKLMQRIWFFFEIIIKSLAHENLQNIEMGLPRLHSFDECLNIDIGSVISNVTEYIYQCSKSDIKTANYLNFYLGFFVSDLFSVCNRFWVLNYVKSYVLRMNSFINAQIQTMTHEPNSIISLKLEFLRIISTHEHFVALNLPFFSDSTGMFDIPSFRASAISSVSQVSTSTLSADSVVGDTLTVEYKQTHFLMGLLLQELKYLLPSSTVSLQKMIICILCQVAQVIDRDTRYNQAFIKCKVVSLFLPLIKIVVSNKEILGQAPKPYLDSTLRNGDNALTLENAMSKIAGVDMSNSQSQQQQPNQLNPELTRNLLSLLLWTFKNLDADVLINWWCDLSEASLIKLVQVLRHCVHVFEYRGREALHKESIKSEEVKQKIEGLVFGNIGARNEMMMRRRQYAPSGSRLQSGQNSLCRTRWDKHSSNFVSLDGTDDNDRLVFESNICCETILICLDLTDYMFEIISFGTLSNGMVKECIALLIDVLTRNQTASVYLSCLNLLRVAVKEHAQFILLEDSELCSNLCLRLLRTSCSKDPEVRFQATLCLYSIMRLSFDLTTANSLSKLKIQLIVALSSLVGLLDQDKATNLQKSMQSLSKYSSKDSELTNTSFPAQIDDLVRNLQGILFNTIKMHEFEKDPEMHMDLMYQVAKGYQSSIDLRLTWLRNMELKHKERENFAEAGMCLLHSAALVCEGLYSVDQNDELPIGATIFEDITENVLEESMLDYNAQNCFSFSQNLSKEGLILYLEKAANCFHKALLFEFSIKCYEHLLDIHRQCRNYQIISEYHKKIEGNCEKIVNLEENQKRAFSSYFRVGFYGSRFEDLDGKEFVYKEGAYTQLSVISSRLETFYAERFGMNVVELLKSSNQVEFSSLDPQKAYIQVTYVEPYFEYYKKVELLTKFGQSTNINEFVYNIPFTKSGKSHGGLKEQYKKRVVLRTEQQFPYLKTRLQVIGKTEEILTPIQVAKEDLTQKLEQFEAVLHLNPTENFLFTPGFDSGLVNGSSKNPPNGQSQQPVDGKRLQLILQGCIGTQVNQGPTEIALTFLNVDDIDADGDGSYGCDGEWTIEHDDLRLLFKKFLRLCKRGLAENKHVIKADQFEYDQQLQRDFDKMKSAVNPLLHNRGPGWISNKSLDQRNSDAQFDSNNHSEMSSSLFGVMGQRPIVDI